MIGCTPRGDTGSNQSQLEFASESKTDPGATSYAANEDSIFAFAVGLRREKFRQAFGLLQDRTFTRSTRTVQYDDTGRQIASRQRIIRKLGPPSSFRYETIGSESAGEFEFGYLDRFVSARSLSQDPADVASLMLPDDPPYLSPRNREGYSYTLLADTIFWDTPTQVVEIRARPEIGDNPDVRLVRMYADRASNELIGLYVEQTSRALGFREESTLYALVHPTADTAWLPARTRFDTRIAVPFRPVQRFRTESFFEIEGVDRLGR